MSGHRHDAMQANQNLGNSLGARSAVRQTKFFRMYESGNTMKALLGTPNLAWDTNKKQGAYHGHPIEDPYTGAPVRHSTGGLGRTEKTAPKVTATKVVKGKDGMVSKEVPAGRSRSEKKQSHGEENIWQTSSAAYGNF
ncbi:unnamed protein product [Cladocopium goreaui]|uniref:Ribosome biogenesis regulatory protein n=1 Tax=Cladocopium goreaui TaxID=2562237 RepID=A0A9P1G4U2_9DINO|nr:unnamed protein product [Cladocopium goreaui]